MKNIIITLLLSIGASIGFSGSAIAADLSHHYGTGSKPPALYETNGKKVNSLSETIKTPENTIVLLFNHGTSNRTIKEPCRPKKNPVAMKSLRHKEIKGNKVLTFHLCSKATGRKPESLTIIRAREIHNTVEAFKGVGVKTDNIFVLGQSRGGWASMYYSAYYGKKNGGVIVFSPSICSDTYDKCKKIINENIKFFINEKIVGILYSHPKEKFDRTRQREFAKKLNTLDHRSDFCKKLPRFRAHGAAFRPCGMELVDGIQEFIKKRAK